MSLDSIGRSMPPAAEDSSERRRLAFSSSKKGIPLQGNGFKSAPGLQDCIDK